MKTFVPAAAGAALLAVCATLAVAEEPPAAAKPAVDRSSAEALFASTTAAMRRADWNAIAETMEPAALESLKARMLRLAAADPGGEAGRAFFGTADPAQLAAVPAPELFGRFMRAAVQFVPQLNAFTAASKSALLGSVKEGDLLHMVYRSTFAFENDEVSSVEVMTVTRRGDSWYTTLHGDFEPIIQAFVDQVEDQVQPPPPPAAIERKE
jgi:hypothetical protein